MNELLSGQIITDPATVSILDAITQWGWPVAAVIIAVGLFATLVKMWPVLTRLVSVVGAVLSLPETVKSIETKLDETGDTVNEVRHEMFPNSGQSYRDEFNRFALDTTSRLAGIERRIGSIHDRSRANTGRISALEEAFGATQPHPGGSQAN